MGLVEMILVLGLIGVLLSTFGIVTVTAIASLFPNHDGPRLLGVCWRLSRQFNLSVGGLRFLVAMATLFTGIVPGVIAYLALAFLNGPSEASLHEHGPQPMRSEDDTRLLGICRDVADRLGVPPGRVRVLFVLATVFTGFAPGIVAYVAAGIVKASVGPAKWREWFGEASAPRAAADWQANVPSIPGRLGRYRILGLLGRGGMGSVWRGRDDALGRDAAVKVVDGPFGSEAVRRFGEEARAAAAIASPHIVQIWEYAPDARPPFLAMEYVPGRSVAQVVRAGGPQPAATAIDCAAQVLAGLAAAHARGVVHRDIKPANILLATSGPSAGTYKLTDFGLATSPDRQHALTATGTLLGTLSYLAPEVAAGDDATASSDLYSLGATLHEMLAGRPPISAESPLKLLRKLSTESIPPIGSVRGDLPADFAAWLDRLVARDPADRFASADRALEALRGVEGFATAATDLDQPRAARSEDAVPWHCRPAPGSPPPLPTAPPHFLPDILGRAMAFEADGRDALGEGSILDIARELNIDAAAVREALRNRSGGGGVTHVFRTALGGKERSEGAPAGSAADGLQRVSGSDLRRGAILGAVIGAVLLPFIVVKVTREANESAHEAEARRVNESAREAFVAIPKGPAEAESGAEALLDAPQPAETAPAPVPALAPGSPAVSEHIGVSFPLVGLVVVLGFLSLATLLAIGFGMALLRRARRRRPERNWP